MKRKRPHNNKRLTSDRERHKQFFIENVVKRGSNATWTAISGWTWCLVKIALSIALVGGAIYGGVHGWQKFFWHNPNYALQDFRFETDGSLTREQVVQRTGFVIGRNIYSYDLVAARETLRSLPQVQSVEVNRYLPNRIEIKAVERKPMAWVAAKVHAGAASPPRAHLLDSSGIVFQPRKTPPEFEPLPLICGVEVEDLDPGKPICKAEVAASLELLRRNAESGAFRAVTVDVSKGYCIVVTDQRQSLLTFGLDDIPQQLERLGIIQQKVAMMGQEIQTVNLIPKVNIPVTLKPPQRLDPVDATVPEPAYRGGTKEVPAAKPGSPVALKEKAPPTGRKTVPKKPAELPRKEQPTFIKRFQAA